MCMYIYMNDGYFAIGRNWQNIVNQLYFNKKIKNEKIFKNQTSFMSGKCSNYLKAILVILEKTAKKSIHLNIFLSFFF